MGPIETKIGGLDIETTELEELIESALPAIRIPGMALAIANQNSDLYAKGFGVTSIQDGCPPVTPQTVFRIGSVTKVLTGTAVMRLAELRKVDLDEPVGKYVNRLHLSQAVQHCCPESTSHDPAGFAISTVQDLANLALMFLNLGQFSGKKILSRESVTEMQRIQFPEDGQASGWGLSFGIWTHNGVQIVGHPGSIANFPAGL